MLLGIDQGTTGSTAVLIHPSGEFLASATAAVPQHFPKPGWIEHDPNEILRSVEEAVNAVFRKAGKSPKDVLAIGVTNQRETVSLFDDDKPLHRFIVWQDRRTADFCAKLKSKEKTIRKLSGLPVDPYFSGSKIHWLLKELKIKNTSKNSSLRFRTIDSFLLRAMTGADVIEATNASRTSLLNLAKVKWDPTLLKIYGVPANLCPEVIPSEGFTLKTRGCKFLPDGIPVKACLGDQQAALFGQAGWNAGAGKITYGTGSFILLNTGSRLSISKNHLVSTLALQWSNGKKLYALEGSAFICGAWIQWLRDQLKMIESSAESETLASSVKSSEGVVVIPALAGMGAPFWKPNARGAIMGLTRGSDRRHLARASLEALCFQNRALVEAMKKDAKGIKVDWRVDGGAVQNNLLMQIQADVLNQKIRRPVNLEATATGVALLAGVSANLLSLDDVAALWKLEREFKPENSKSYQDAYARWLKAVSVL